MPGLWETNECKREELSDQFWKATLAHREALDRLGFSPCSCRKLKEHLNPAVRDNGGIFYLDNDKMQFARLIYFKRVARSQPEVEVEIIRIAFTAAFEAGSLSCTNEGPAFDSLPDATIVRIPSSDAAVIYKEFSRLIHERPDKPRTFPSVEAVRQWFDAKQQESFEERVRRGLFVPMTDAEVEVARRRLSQPPAKPPRGLFAFRLNLKAFQFVALFILALWLIDRFRHKVESATGAGDYNRASDDVMEYQGQQFKMSKAYTSYEDYKDDPDNLNTNELDRIEKVMLSVKTPPSFKNDKEFMAFMFDLEFPGYGLSGCGAESDDGSTLDVESVEIPQRSKDRWVVVQETRGKLNLVDDFVYGSDSNLIAHVKLTKKRLSYYDQKGIVVREKPLSQ